MLGKCASVITELAPPKLTNLHPTYNTQLTTYISTSLTARKPLTDVTGVAEQQLRDLILGESNMCCVLRSRPGKAEHSLRLISLSTATATAT